MAYAGWNTRRALDQTEHRGARIQQDFVFRNSLLNQIRADVYISGTYVRDYLLEPNLQRADGYRTDLVHVRREMEAAIESYAKLPGETIAAPLDRLQAQLADYWRTLEPALVWTAAERHQKGYGFLRDDVFPRRRAVLDLADEIQSLNEDQLQRSNERVRALFSGVRTGMDITLFATLSAGILLSSFSIVRILQVEKQATARHQETAQARKQLKELSARLVHAQENERRAISRELHDEVGQSMSALLVGLGNLSANLSESAREAVAPQLNTLREIAESSVRAVRNMSLLLRPSMLDDLGLAPALRWQARETARQFGVRVDVATDEACNELPEELRTCTYRVVQEGLLNAARHARAKLVRIHVRKANRSLFLTIQDDGCGFDAHERGLGLLGIQERIANLGGAFKIDSQPGRGTLLAASLPAPGRRRMIRILLADDHTILRTGLRAVLERHADLQVVGEASDGRQAVQVTEKDRPDVVIMDVGMPLLNGIEAARQITAKNPQIAIVVLSMHSDEGYVLRALKAGARGYLLKDSAEADLINAIRAVRDGKAFFSAAISRMLVDDYMRELQQRGVEDSYELLTNRERELLQLLAEGKSNKDIARMLDLSLYTVETHRSNILEKLNLHSVPELMLYAIRKGVIS